LDLSSHISNLIHPKTGSGPGHEPFVGETWRRLPAVDFLIAKRRQEYFRVDDPAGVFPPNYGDVWRLDATMGHGATALVDYFEFRGTGWGPGSNASALLNIRYIPSPAPVPGMPKVFEGTPAVYRMERGVPRAFVASRFRAFDDGKELLSWLRSPLMAPRQ